MARASATMSALPEATISSACFGSVIRPTAMVVRPVASLIAWPNGTWGPGRSGIFCSGETPPEDASIQSTPRFLSSCANSMVCARSQPPSTQSVEETRTPTGLSAGNAARTASNTSSGKGERVAGGTRWALGGGAAILIGALVGNRRQELGQQIAVRRVHLDGVDAEPLGAL